MAFYMYPFTTLKYSITDFGATACLNLVLGVLCK